MSIEDLRKHLTRLEAQIIHLRRVLVHAERQRIAVQEQLQKVATFPVVSLPVEITIQIFTHCLPTIKELLKSSRHSDLRDPPLVFLGVCRRWRDIALGTPALWSTLQMRFDAIPLQVISEPGVVEGFVDRWLGRAKNRPLSLVLHTDKYEGEDYFDFGIERVRDIIRRHAPRIESLDLYSSRTEMRKLALDSVAFPLLQRVVVCDVDGWLGDDSADPVDVFSNAPLLTRVHLFENTTYSSFVFPALQLTEFEGRLDDLEFFNLAPNLITAKCMVDFVPEPPSVVTHAHLQSLTLAKDESDPSDPMDILPHLILPKLETLDVSDIKDMDPASISGLVQRSAAKLDTLCITVPNDLYFSRWLGCLGVLNDTLEHLSVHSPSSSFLSLLTILGDPRYERAGPALPHLKALSISHAGEIHFGDLVECLTRRSPRLESFSIRFKAGTFLHDEIYHEGSRTEIVSILSTLAEEGMDIHIGSGGRKEPYVQLIRS
ncbi:hypothetical protein FB45DRAFT_426170 [Roridomyces roridus]|uniref:F-box domain-containing protein n=1 Tax=Roridomyces roridus TaxID=1738132 RepID=A0AAD7C5V6_9AGAR|nr:hypothetical protein FB45DRAFT_426170 [Roridomyces roridus]